MSVLPRVVPLDPVPDPHEAFRALHRLGGVLFLDSALEHPDLGRYSFIVADPFEEFTLPEDPHSVPGEDPLADLERALREWHQPAVEGLPPFQGGLAGLLGYGLGRRLERLPPGPPTPFPAMDLVMGVYDWVLAFDHVEDRAWIIAQGFPHTTEHERDERARWRIEQVLACLREGPEPGIDTAPEELGETSDPATWPFPTFPLEGPPGLLSNFTPASYQEVLRRAIDAIFEGEIFQVNLAQQLFYPLRISTLELYRRLRQRNPAPFAAYYAPRSIPVVYASASPERFVRVGAGGQVETRPIKGTRPRSRRPEEDCYSRDALRESEKDRSENVMIVDLLRNDLSRVCKPRSVTVPRLFDVETYASVHHLVSVVHGELAEGRDGLDLLRAAFPGGSITGAPKIRAMEIITELEPTARGAYCGSLGYLSFSGTLDTSILIRTVTASRGWLQFPVGGGIVAGSSPPGEYVETLDKARGILWALE